LVVSVRDVAVLPRPRDALPLEAPAAEALARDALTREVGPAAALAAEALVLPETRCRLDVGVAVLVGPPVFRACGRGAPWVVAFALGASDLGDRVAMAATILVFWVTVVDPSNSPRAAHRAVACDAGERCGRPPLRWSWADFLPRGAIGTVCRWL
jgi:hypothetical protein